jgi:hypothetical protein
MSFNIKLLKYGCLVIVFMILVISIGCSVPEKYAEPVSEDNIENDLGVNGTQTRLYLQVGSSVKSILPWEHFLDYKNYDIIGVDTGAIKAATITAGATVLPELAVITAPFLDAVTMGFNGGIFLCCTNNSSALTAQGLQLSGMDTTLNGYDAYNLATGMTFRLSDTATAPVEATFELWGITAGVAKQLASETFSITFRNAQHSMLSITPFDSVPNSDLTLNTSSDSLFTFLWNDLKYFDSTGRAFLKPKGDSASGTICEKEIAYACSYNAKLILAQRLLQKIDTNYVYPVTNPWGTTLPVIPAVGPALDQYLCLYSNISGLLDVLNDFKDGYTSWKLDPNHQIYKNLESFLENVVCDGNIGGLDPSSFSRLILFHTDFLLYAGLCAYIDNDFFSRYINHFKVLVDEVKSLVDKVAPEYHNNNIVMRFYAVAVFYDFILDRGTDNLQTLTDYLDVYVDSIGEYGEGIHYFNYMAEILMPIIYLGLQEHYISGSHAGEPWLSDTSRIVQIFRSTGEYQIDAANNWGELPAFDDGETLIPYLAPYAVITGKEKFKQYSHDVMSLKKKGIYDSIEAAERTPFFGDVPWQMILYPLNRTFSGSGSWRHSLDSVRRSGSIVQIPAGSARENLCMTIIAEEDPASGGTHDQIDHGAIQFARYINNLSGTAPHVDHLIIDPGYPGFQENKRHLKEWQYPNQNVQMLLDTAFSFSTDSTYGVHSKVSDQPDKDADDEELLGSDDSKNYETAEKYDYRVNGGMSGYRFLTPWEVRTVVHKYVLRDAGLQNNMWEIVDAKAMSEIKAKSLSSRGGEGKSSVINRYRNGVEVRIDYKYPKSQELFHFKEQLSFQMFEFYYSRGITYETSHYGIRGIYSLGNNYFVVDHLPENTLPASISLATSWNMPKNTSVLGTTGWQRFVFRGTTPSGQIPGTSPPQFYTPRSRIEISVASADTVTSVVDSTSMFEITGGNFLQTNHLTFKNDLSSCNFLLTQFRVSDALVPLLGISSQQVDTITVSGGMVWRRTYSDNSKDLLCYNPSMDTVTTEGVTSDAKVWLLHADASGLWQEARLFNGIAPPTFTGFPFPPVVTVTGGVLSEGVQYDITF